MGKKYRLAVIEDNPVHYRIPIYRELAKSEKVDTIVYFATEDRGSKRYLFESRNKKGTEIKIKNNNFKYRVLKNYCPFGQEFSWRGLWRFGWNFGIINELIKQKYDAVIIYGYSSMYKKLGYVGAILSGTPIIFREEIHEFLGGKVKNSVKSFIFRNFLFKLPSVFLPSYTKSKEFYHNMGVPYEKLFLHPCAVDNKFYRGMDRKINKEKAKKELGIPKDSCVFLSVGTINERKGCAHTLRAFEKLKGRNNYFIFLGEGPEKENLLEYRKEKKIKNVLFFKFKSNLEEVAKFYALSDVFVISSREDVCPKVFNEAMNFSVPIIASNKIGTAPDLIRQGENGYIYEYGNIEELRKYMQKLINDKKLRERMGKESLKIVNMWSIEADVKATIKALEYIYGKKTSSETNR